MNNDHEFSNQLDSPIDFYWKDGGVAVTGMGGKHSNYHEDRVYYFYASPVTVKTKPGSCGWTIFLNDWDEKLDIQLDSRQYIAGMYSYHNDRYEDRRWKLYVCSVEDKVS